MEEKEACIYEPLVIRARNGFIAYALLAILVPVVAAALCYGLEKPSIWIARGGAIMAGVAFLADLKARDMADVFKPSGFVSDTFNATRSKYISQVAICQKIGILLILVGTAVWGFGDILPSGAAA
ncbi:hypothetical protein ACQKEN_16920 [Pseudomonas sp. NPDC078416]|uniref:hypothetical protein n=1 Tax=Pseudomonas sp. NPDC078416 TaxID=3390637 RepID=UPI003D00D7C6